jgi:uncharacterized protein
MVARARQAGFSGAVVFPFERGTLPDYRLSNDRVLKAAQRWPELLCPFSRVDARDAAASIDELERVRAAGTRGVKIHPLFDRVNPRAPETAEVLASLSGTGLPVLVHTNRGENSHPSHWGPLFRDLPDVPFVLGHAGFFEWRSALELACSLPNVYVETSLSSVLILEKIAEFAPPERILFGSDAPYGDHRGGFENLRQAILRAAPPDPQAALDLAFHKNAERLVGRTFEAPVAEAMSPAEPSIAATLITRDGELSASVYQISDENCSFWLEDANADPTQTTEIRLRLGDRWHRTGARVAFGHAGRFSAFLGSPPPTLIEAIVEFHTSTQALELDE